MLTFTGVLERGEQSRVQEILELLGRVQPGDEAITFSIAASNLVLSRARFRQAGKEEGVAGQLLWIEHGGVLINISDAEQSRQAAARLQEGS
jgi:hypothetical protein